MKLTVEERFWAKVDTSGNCWEWKPTDGRQEYGHFWNGTRMMRAHRFAYELLVGPIPEGLQLDHLCRNRGCVNPEHLEPVTSRENTLRGYGPTARKARQTHCRHGHEFTEKSTYVTPEGHRICRTCRNLFQSQYKRVGTKTIRLRVDPMFEATR